MQFSAVEIRFIVTTYHYSTFANDLKRKYFFSKNVHSYRVCSFKYMLIAEVMAYGCGPRCTVKNPNEIMCKSFEKELKSSIQTGVVYFQA